MKKFKVKQEKRKSNILTETIINNLTDGLIILDEDKKIVKVNSQAERIFLLKAKQVEGRDIGKLKASPLLSKTIGLILKKGRIKEVRRMEFSPGEKITIELTSVPITNQGEKKGYLLMFHDISRQKLVEKLKTEFVSLSAHQLRTPLSGIKWNLQMLIGGSFGKLTAEQEEFLKMSYRANERMIKLIDDLLDVTKIEEGRYLYYIRKENIVKIVEETIKSLREKIKQKNIDFNFLKPEEKVPKIEIDKEKIAICVQNLLTNAIIYNKPKGKVTVSVKYDKKKKEVLIKVKDNGMGIPATQQKRIFSKFYRASSAIKKETSGSGLGLYITKNIIEAHNGEIWFKSKEGKGSTFYFILPINNH